MTGLRACPRGCCYVDWVASAVLTAYGYGLLAEKQTTPEVGPSEVVTDRTTPSWGVHGGRSGKCA